MASKVKIPNREKYLIEMAEAIRPKIEKESGKLTPPYRISMGFPSRNALSIKKRVVGQCWGGMASADGVHQLFISPVLHAPVEIAATVAHELIHANVGTEVGHRKPFSRVAYAIGLKGKPTATYAGDAFVEQVKGILGKLGDFPHAPLTAHGKYKPQGTRLLKAMCMTDGYNVRVTAKWATQAPPVCPLCMTPMHVTGLIVD